MAGIGHVGIGLAAKRVAPEVPTGVLLLAVEASDILWGVFALAGIESRHPLNPGSAAVSPWSHGLFMSAVWSVITALLAARVYRNSRTGAVIGLLVFSHWVLDFISHLMWPSTLPDLPLLFAGSPKVGLGLYRSPGVSLATDLGLLILGVVIYIRTITARKRLGA